MHIFYEYIRKMVYCYVWFWGPLCTDHAILRMRSELFSFQNEINAIFAYNIA